MSTELRAGDILGRYRIESLIGEGGMGRVYRARDLSLQRDVALKVIHAALSDDTVAAARFEREALAVAALSHPNILALHDISTHEETTFAVMELLEGDTLRARLASGPLPVRKVVEYGLQMASALAAAHGRGIVHRDFKPDNLFITRDAQVKVLDFGLAQLAPAGVPVSGEATTMVSSTPGLVLGTPGYMAPEQLRGGPVDARADIFALGAVLYEMLSGRRAFEGSSQADVLSAILERDPPEMSGVPATIPAPLDRLVRRCLEKSPDDRFQSARDLAFALEAVGFASVAATAPVGDRGARRLWRVLVSLAAAVILLAAGAVAARLAGGRTAAAPPLPIRFSIDIVGGVNSDVAISRDGRYVAFSTLSKSVDSGNSEAAGLWVRALDSTSLQGLPRTPSGGAPAFSPDGREIWFTEGSALVAIDRQSLSRRVVVDQETQRGETPRPVSFNAEGDALLSRGDAIAVLRNGTTTSVPVTVLDRSRDQRHRGAVFLPDGRRFLFSAFLKSGVSEVRVGSLENSAPGARVDLPLDVSDLLVDPSGYVLFMEAGALVAQPFDLDRVRPTGPTVRIAESALRASVSGNGVLVSRTTANQLSQFEWVDRFGRTVGTVGPVDAFNNFDLSPDNTSIATIRRRPDEGSTLMLIDTRRGSIMPLLSRQAFLSDPTWSPDGLQIAVRDATRLVIRNIRDKQERVIGELSGFPDSWSRDGKWLLVGRPNQSMYELRALALDGSGRDIPLVTGLRLTDEPRFSPDARWIVYHAQVDRRPEIFAIPFPPTGQQWQLSVDGGVQPRWRADGRELYYLDPVGHLMRVGVPDGDASHAETPQPLFDLHLQPSNAWDQFTPSADGSRFLIRRPSGGAEADISPVQVLVNWTAMFPELHKRQP